MHALGTLMPEETELPFPDLMTEWETYFRRETLTGPVAGTTPIVTSQSPPYYPPSPVMPPPNVFVPNYGTPNWVYPVAIGGVVLLAVLVFASR